MRRLVIIGGVAGGMSAATRARRLDENAQITVIEKGGYISFANCGLPYHLGGRIQREEDLLLTNPRKVWQRFRIDARVHEEALSIDRTNKTVHIRRLSDGLEYTLVYDKLILAPGATAITPPLPNIDAPNVLPLRSMEDMQRIGRFLETGSVKHMTIIGGGFIGLEMAESMIERGIQVAVVEKMPRVLPPVDPEMARFVEQELGNHGVAVYSNNGLKALRGSPEKVREVELEDGTVLTTDVVLMSIGVRPNVGLAKEAGLIIGNTGAIEVNQYQQTNDPDIYAVGDAAEVVHTVHGKKTRIPLAGPANRQGRLAGEHAVTGQASPIGTVSGTAIVKVFDLTVAVTGLGEKLARDNGFEVDTAYVVANHHAGYYPGAQLLRLKLIYDKTSGRILGAQIVGRSGVDKRIDVLATAIQFQATVEQLTTLDLAYAPQFGSAKDPVHLAGFVAMNQLRNISRGVVLDQTEDDLMVDVRTPSEFASGTLPRAKNIPLEQLRERMGELDPDRPITVFCQIGQRGFVAERILRQHGFKNVRNLKGGYAMIHQD